MVSQPNFKISPETLSGPIDFFLPIAVNFFLMILLLMAKGSPELALYLRDATLTAEYRRIIEIKGVSLFY
jgi:hypothetical protein